MNHSQALTLRAFLAALADADPLSPDLTAQINAIGQNLDDRVGELDQLVKTSNNPALTAAYQSARRWLSSQAAERKAGLDVLPDNTPENNSPELENTSRDISPLEARLQALESMSLPDLSAQARQVMKDFNPVAAVHVTFPAVY